jgi:hypothetical protein
MAKIKEAIEDFKPDSRLVGMGTTRAEEALTSTAGGELATGDQRLPMRRWFVRVPVWPWGQVNIKPVSDTWFSERYGLVPTVVVLGVRFTWREWR